MELENDSTWLDSVMAMPNAQLSLVQGSLFVDCGSLRVHFRFI
jgi:hypothetical protein